MFDDRENAGCIAALIASLIVIVLVGLINGLDALVSSCIRRIHEVSTWVF